MAGDWIKVEKITPEKPEIVRMAAILKRDPDEIFGKIFKIWAWADDQSTTGAAMQITEDFINRKAGRKGFAGAMREVGWLTGECGNLEFPGFHRHNGETAKARAESNRRMSKLRSNRNKIVTDVTEKAQQKAQPEKRREENIVEIYPAVPSADSLCSLEQAVGYAPTVRMTPEQASHWWHVRNASGWTKGSTGGGIPRKITSWQSDMATSRAWVGESLSKAKTSKTGTYGGSTAPESELREWEK